MTPKISLIIGVVLAALSVVPAAFGEGRLAGSPEPAKAIAPDWFERAVIRTQSDVTVVSRPDSHEVGRQAVAPDWFERAAAAAQRRGEVPVVRRGDDFVRLDPNTLPSPTVTATSGSDIQWPQLGIGVGFGILLAFGLYLAMRMTKVRPLAH